MKNLQEIIEELKEKVADNKEAFEAEGEVYRQGKADAFKEALDLITNEL